MHELYKMHRPKMLRDLIGQDETVKIVKKMLVDGKIPHAIMLSGPSGVGKTSLARILQSKLNCEEGDFREINCASARGIDTIRDIQTKTGCSAFHKDGTRIWYFDEAHKITNDAQSSMLKMLEDVPSHVYFILATTDPGKLLKTIHTRCTELKLRNLTTTELTQLVKKVLEAEKQALSSPVITALVESVEGSARKALVMLEQILSLDTDKEQLETIQSADAKRQAYELMKMLVFNDKQGSWLEAVKILKDIEEEPETIRRQVLGLATKALLDNPKNKARAFNVICAFEANFFDSGKAGLVRATMECLENRK